AEDGIRDKLVTGVQTCALPIFRKALLVPIAVLWDVPEYSINVAGVTGPTFRGYGNLSGMATLDAPEHRRLPPLRRVTSRGRAPRSEERRVGKEWRSRWSTEYRK